MLLGVIHTDLFKFLRALPVGDVNVLENFRLNKFLKRFKTFETHENSQDFASKLKAFEKFFEKVL